MLAVMQWTEITHHFPGAMMGKRLCGPGGAPPPKVKLVAHFRPVWTLCPGAKGLVEKRNTSPAFE